MRTRRGHRPPRHGRDPPRDRVRHRAAGFWGQYRHPHSAGVFEGIRAAVKFKYGRTGLKGVRVAVQGLGGVGSCLCAHLRDAGAELVVSDLDEAVIGCVVAESGAEALDPSEILFAEADVLAPCALGAVLNDQTIPKLRASIVCGGANNQLAETRHAKMLKERASSSHRTTWSTAAALWAVQPRSASSAANIWRRR